MVQGTGDMLKECFVQQEPSAFSSGGQESVLKRRKLSGFFFAIQITSSCVHPSKCKIWSGKDQQNFLVLKKQDCAGSGLTEVLMCDWVGTC